LKLWIYKTQKIYIKKKCNRGIRESVKVSETGSYYNRNSSDDTCARRDIGQGLVNCTASKIIATGSFYNFCPTTRAHARPVTYIQRAVGCSFSIYTSFLLLFFFFVSLKCIESSCKFAFFIRCYYLHYYYHKMDLCFFSTHMGNDNNISHHLFHPAVLF